jgi:hypothetical protein
MALARGFASWRSSARCGRWRRFQNHLKTPLPSEQAVWDRNSLSPRWRSRRMLLNMIGTSRNHVFICIRDAAYLSELLQSLPTHGKLFDDSAWFEAVSGFRGL